MKKIIFTGLAVIISSTALTGCVTSNASKTTGNDYRTSEVRQAGEVFYGELLQIRNVTIHENERTQDRNQSQLGAGGALVGGVIGGNSNGLNGMIIGGLIGAAAGAMASGALSETPGYEMDIRLPNGQVIVVTQAKKEGEVFGSRVRVVKYGNTYRVTPAN